MPRRPDGVRRQAHDGHRPHDEAADARGARGAFDDGRRGVVCRAPTRHLHGAHENDRGHEGRRYLGRDGVDDLRAPHGVEGAPEGPHGEVGHIAGRAELEIARRVAPRAREGRHEDRRRQHDPGRGLDLVGDDGDDAQDGVERRVAQAEPRLEEPREAKRHGAERHEPQRVRQAPALPIDALERGARREQQLPDAPREAPPRADPARRRHVRHRLRS